MWDRTRSLVFYLVCIPVRASLAVVTSVACDAPDWVRHVLAGFFAYVSIGFVGQIFRDAPYGGFGGPVWWKWNRYFHAPLYALALVLLYTRCEYAWTPLVADLAVALVPT